MAPKIFITGATGLIGGDYLVGITQKHPDWEISTLIRDPTKAKIVEEHFPSVRIVHGSLANSGLLERESKAADVVLNFANCDHLPAAEAIVRGISQRDEIGTLIHTSGAKIIAWEMESQPSTWGKFMPRRYNDMEGVEELTRGPSEANPNPTGFDNILPNWAAHRDVDLAVLDGFRKHRSKVRTAIVCPPTVYGPSRFPGFTTSIQIPRLLNVVLQLGQAFTINGNENKWNKVHTQDISVLYILLTEAAVSNQPVELWNEKGYHFAEGGEFIWGDVIRRIAELGYQKGLLSSPEPVELPNATVHQFWRGGQMNMSSTSLGESQRAKQLLGWNPTRDELLEDLDRTIDVEAEILGLSLKK
ncbi:unnamed protein product [Penicillium olsonii]|uniref:NAD(P)-binding domain-containing protein n=1 Tax=Penicillium olsonii TaxID=99116 RepID=A0A9W4ICH1_PENOL|nr:unnamed protein product [Penicillium olsonii]CAG8248153.1 unnamed protein product [Penicillium olsonii]CAG8260799.1 unnamed protein product [Penicillium olsonii]